MGSRTTAVVVVIVVAAALSNPSFAAERTDWIARSDDHARVLLELLARFSPEAAGRFGVEGLDEEIFDLEPRIHERQSQASHQALSELERRLDSEDHLRVRQDVEILIRALQDNIRGAELQRENLLPYFNLSRTVFQGIRALIDPQVPEERYPAAVVRLRRYAGMEKGYEPIAELARARTRERFEVQGLLGPFRGEVEQDLQRAETFIDGIGELFEGTSLEGWREPYGTLAADLRSYNRWIRSEVLPRAREDFRQPLELYQHALRNWGVAASPQELIERSTQAYNEIRNEMMALAPLVAKERGYGTADYREVIRLLKQERIPGDKLLEFYRDRLGDLERIIVEQALVTLPERKAGIRIGSAAETAAQPAPHLDLPRLIGNTGEFPEFVLPSVGRDADGRWKPSDDSFEANAWTLTAHEARPGHELQFSSIIENGTSITRALFAFNSANVEGWALYAEALSKPFLPLDAQLISLQYRLARAARMFLDPMLNLGKIEPEAAKRLLTEDVVLGGGWAQNEIERYTYRMPGQATAYFYGYSRLQVLRTQTELALGERFDQRDFHDFVLAQGLLPPEILEKAVRDEFIPQQARDAENQTSAGSLQP
jgi:hypothetical protein